VKLKGVVIFVYWAIEGSAYLQQTCNGSWILDFSAVFD